MKKILLSLALLATVAPALGMENGKNEIEKEGKQAVEINNKPTFGKLIDGNLLNKSQVWAAVIAFKKQLQGITAYAGPDLKELPAELIEQIFFHYLSDTTIDPKIRANVTLEFLADPEYGFWHKALLREHITQDTYPLSEELNYDKALQEKLKSSFFRESFMHWFANEGEDLPFEHFEYLNFATKEDLIKIIVHVFSVNPIEIKQMRTLIQMLKQIVIACYKHKIDLNFESEDGLTPLMWTQTVRPVWRNNGHNEALQKLLIGAGARMDYKTKKGQSFIDQEEPRTIELYKKILKRWETEDQDDWYEEV